MDVIREVTGEEAKLLAIQFLGQNIGEMKELDKQIVSSLKPLTSSIDPNRMVHSIPQTQAQQPQPQPEPVQHIQPIVHTEVVTQPVGPVVIPSLASLHGSTAPVTTHQPTPTVDPNQLELNFNSSPYSEQIFNKLDSLERKINNFIEAQQQIIESIEAIKKKAEAIPVAV